MRTSNHPGSGTSPHEEGTRYPGTEYHRDTQPLSVSADTHRPYAQPAGQWHYVPAGPEDAQRQQQASSSSETSLVLGILGVTVLPILAPFALWQATKAEKLGGRATAGKVLGWVGVVLLILMVLWFVFFFAIWGFAMNEFMQQSRSSV